MNGDAIEADIRPAPRHGNGHLGLRVVQAADVADGHVRDAGPGLDEHVELTERRVARNGVGPRPRAQVGVVREDGQPGPGLHLRHRLEHLPLVGRHDAALLPDLAERAVPFAERLGGEGIRQFVGGLSGE